MTKTSTITILSFITLAGCQDVEIQDASSGDAGPQDAPASPEGDGPDGDDSDDPGQASPSEAWSADAGAGKDLGNPVDDGQDSWVQDTTGDRPGEGQEGPELTAAPLRFGIWTAQIEAVNLNTCAREIAPGDSYEVDMTGFNGVPHMWDMAAMYTTGDGMLHAQGGGDMEIEGADCRISETVTAYGNMASDTEMILEVHRNFVAAGTECAEMADQLPCEGIYTASYMWDRGFSQD